MLNNRIRYTKEMDLFILNHVYKDKSISDIQKLLNISNYYNLYAHIHYFFGKSPRCSNHYFFNKNCNDCQKNHNDWYLVNLEKINKYKYKNIKKNSNECYQQQLKYYKSKLNHTREMNIKKKTIKFKSQLIDDIYISTLNFLYNDFKILKGRNIEVVFLQLSRLYIFNYLSNYDYSKDIPFKLLEYVFKIKPNFPIIHYLIPLLIEKDKSFVYLLPEPLLFTLKDISAINNYFSKKDIMILFNALYTFNKSVKHNNEGYLSTLLYLYSEYYDMHITQHYLSEIFNITEVTLRTKRYIIKQKYIFQMNIFNESIKNINFDKLL